jgi:hypothetical protein
MLQVFIFPNADTNTVDEYFYSNNSVRASTSPFSFSDYYRTTISVVFPVPAKWFSGLPGGCLGIF